MRQIGDKMVEETRERLLQMLFKALGGEVGLEPNLEDAETLAFCYKCLVDKEIEVHHIPIIIGSKEEAKEVVKTAEDYLLKELIEG